MEEQRHYSIIEPYNRKLTLTYNDTIIAETKNALMLKEVAKRVYDPVFYIPKDDLQQNLAPESGRKSHCPIKGDASYWLAPDGPTDQYFAWSYEDPLPRVKKIEGYIAFNMDYISFTSEPI